MRMICTLVFVACVFGAGGSASGQPPLLVGMELAYPPFEMADASGEPVGVSVELARALAESLQRPLEVRNIPFDGLIPSLRTGKIDLIISSMTATDERRKAIDFSDPYLKTGLCLLVGKSSSVKGIGDLDASERTVAVKKGTTGHLYATDHLRKSNVKVLDKETTCVLEVVQGRADAFIYDQMSVYQNWRKNEETTRALLKPFKQESWAIGVRQGNDELLKRVNAFLPEFRQGGGFDRLGEKYLKEQKDAFKELGIPFFF